ncbi:putative proliferating cell nuclear antigen [Namao virus]|nr:putative proliferating cell nuclear antigen [Namao virus]
METRGKKPSAKKSSTVFFDKKQQSGCSVNSKDNFIYDDCSKYILKVTTKKITEFKIIIESLKDIFKDVIIKFYPADSTCRRGLYIGSINSSSTLVVKICIPPESFDFYHCQPFKDHDHVEIGVNMLQFCKIIKTIHNNYMILFVKRDRINELGIISFKIGDSSCYIASYLQLLDISETDVSINNILVKYKIRIKSDHFSTLIKNIGSFGENMEILFINKNSEKIVIFKCSGEFITQVAKYRFSEGWSEKDNVAHDTAEQPVVSKRGRKSKKESREQNHHEQEIEVIDTSQDPDIMFDTENTKKKDTVENQTVILQAMYEIKLLAMFSKCTNLCKYIDMYLLDTLPLILSYVIPELGTVSLIISPKNNVPDVKYIYSGSEEEDDDDLKET